MDRATLDRIVSQIETYMDEGSTALWETEAPQPASRYADPAWQAREQALIRSQPLVVGHSSQLRTAGDFLTHDAAGLPILLVRQQDGSLKAMLNICTHRGARLVCQTEGQRRAFSCPYHAWTFKIDGSVLGVPRGELAFPNIDRCEHALATLPVQERHGFVWVVPTPGAAIDVAAHLGPELDAELAAYGADAMVLERQQWLSTEMNWKFVLDGFLEVYHFSTLHAKTIAPYFVGNHSPFESLGRHGRMVGVRASFESVRGKPREAVATFDLLKHLAINYYIFPNTLLVWQGDHFECWTAFPGKQPDRCMAHVQSVTTVEAAAPEFRSKWDRNWKVMIDTVVDEDWAMSKTIQDSVHAMPRNRIVFGRNEPGLQHFHGQLARHIEAGGPAAQS